MFQIGDEQRMIKKKKLYHVYDYGELLDKKNDSKIVLNSNQFVNYKERLN